MKSSGGHNKKEEVSIVSAPKNNPPVNHRLVAYRLSALIWQSANRLHLFGAFIGLLVGRSAVVVCPFLLKYSIDQISPSTKSLNLSSSTIPLLAIASYGLARVAAQLSNEVRDYLFARVSFYSQRQLLVSVFNKLFSLNLDYHLNRKTGAVSRILERGFRALQFVSHFMILNIIPTIVEVLLVTVILAYNFPPSFAIITISTVLIYIAYSIILTEYRTTFRKAMNELDSQANSRAVDALINYETVKYFSREATEGLRYDQSLAQHEAVALRAQGLLGFLNTGQAVIISLGLFGVMLLAAQEVVAGGMTVGDFVLVNTFLLQLYLPLNFLGFVYREIKQGLVDIEALFSILDEKSQTETNDESLINMRDSQRNLTKISSKIEFKNVSFSYPNGTKVLHNISFSVSAGKSIALVGESGSGKSTISRLLFGYYQPQEGEILIDDVPIQNYSLSSRRKAIGIVSQDPVLFHESIRYNLLYANAESDEKDLWYALKLAHAEEFVKRLPSGLDTIVGERGLKLSGGERQRIALARVFLKRPLIFIFDEATSSLDTATESEIQSALSEVSKGTTTISIAHRLSTIVDADEIIVMRRGEIIEQGTHEALLEKNGDYTFMWHLQERSETESTNQR